MNFDVKERVVLVTLAGSQIYGTATPTSDYDIKGVCIPPLEFYFGNKVFEGVDDKQVITDLVKNIVLKDDFAKMSASGIEGTVYELRKFVKLAADCNPNILDVLFCREEDVLFQDDVGELLRRKRDMFLSKKALYTFRGYAIAQLKRIKSHKKWLLEPADVLPTREQFGLKPVPTIDTNQLQTAMAAITKKVDGWEPNLDGLDEAERIRIMEHLATSLVEMSIAKSDRFQAAGRLIGYEENFLKMLEQERAYNEAVKQHHSYKFWESDRNETRAALEKHFGYDTKHAAHLVRLMRMCEELLTTGKVNVFRADAEELLAIRNGAWSYGELIEYAERMDSELIATAAKSSLPREPDRVAIDKLLVELIEARFADE